MPAVASESQRKKARASSMSEKQPEIFVTVEGEKNQLLLHLQRQCFSQKQIEEKDSEVLEQFGLKSEEFISIFADLLQAIAENGDQVQGQINLTKFHDTNPPDISIYDYLHRYAYKKFILFTILEYSSLHYVVPCHIY
jgi:hypothetical protein